MRVRAQINLLREANDSVNFLSKAVSMTTTFDTTQLFICTERLLITMAEELKKQGLFVDESYVLRVLEPNVAKDSQDLKEENEVFLESKLNSPVFRGVTKLFAFNLQS